MPVHPHNEYAHLSLNRELKIWAKKNNIRPMDLRRDTGWSEQHCYRLFTGKDKFGHSALGLFTLVYGVKALEDILRMAKVDAGKKEVKDDS